MSYDPERAQDLETAVADARRRIEDVLALGLASTRADALDVLGLVGYLRRDLAYLHYNLPPWKVWRITQFAPVTGRGRATRVWLDPTLVPGPLYHAVIPNSHIGTDFGSGPSQNVAWVWHRNNLMRGGVTGTFTTTRDAIDERVMDVIDSAGAVLPGHDHDRDPSS
jgi:hypothetical protein